MALRRHSSDDHDPRPQVQRFQMRQKLISIGDDYWIEDAAGNKAFHVNGKALRIRDTWELEDRVGATVAKIKERKVTIRDKMTVDLGDRSATITKRKLGFRDHFKVEVEHGEELKVHGNVVDHEYEIETDRGTVAKVSKKWFRVRDTYGVEIEPFTDVVLMLAITVAVDAMSHER